MAIELFNPDEPRELTGALTRDDLREVIAHLGPDTAIHSLQIGITTADAAPLAQLPAAADPDSETPSADGGTVVPPLQPDGGPFRLVQVMADAETGLRTAEVREMVPDDSPISSETTGPPRWQVADRGRLEKRAAEADQRHNEYRITATGDRAVAHAREGTADGPSSAEQPTESAAKAGVGGFFCGVR